MRYVVPQELKSPTKVNKWLYLFDLFFIIGYFMCGMMFQSLVHPSIRIPYYIFNLFMAVCLTFKSPYNKGKRIFQSIYFFLLKDRFIYKPISNRKEKPQLHEQRITKQQ